MHFTRISQNQTLLKIHIYRQDPGKICTFTKMPLVYSPTPGKIQSLAMWPLGQPVAGPTRIPAAPAARPAGEEAKED
jgi:hypothetical protein